MSARITVVLPFQSPLSEGRRSLEFYRGMLLAAATMRDRGYKAEISAYDEGTPDADITATLEQAMTAADVIVGCYYRDHIIAASRAAEIHSRIAAFPLANYIPQPVAGLSSALFTIPTPSRRAEQAATLALGRLGKANVLLLTSPPAISTKGIATGTVPATSVTEAREMSAILKKGGCKLKVCTTMAEVAAGLSSRRINLIITDQDTPESLATFAKEARRLATAVAGEAHIAILGLPGWSDAARQQMLQGDHRAYDVLLPTTSYVHPSSSDISRLRTAYSEWFHCEAQEGPDAPLYMGYDWGLAAISGLAHHGREFVLKPSAAQLLVHDFRFERAERDACLTDGGLRLLHLRNDGGIDMIVKSK